MSLCIIRAETDGFFVSGGGFFELTGHLVEIG